MGIAIPLRVVKAHLIHVALVAVLGAATGCASPTAPSAPLPEIPTPPASQSVVLTVRVLTRTSEVPIEDALVQMPKGTGRTDASGSCTFSLAPGEMADVDVSASGYVPLGASAVLRNDQRWTFYLESATKS